MFNNRQESNWPYALLSYNSSSTYVQPSYYVGMVFRKHQDYIEGTAAVNPAFEFDVDRDT